jgi:hypothetical protein
MAKHDPKLGGRRNYPAYDEDFGAWADAQAETLRARRFEDLDVDNLVEEVEG